MYNTFKGNGQSRYLRAVKKYQDFYYYQVPMPEDRPAFKPNNYTNARRLPITQTMRSVNRNR